MITEIQLKNFKAWRDTKPMRVAPVTMLLGTNSSGKSSLIQSLLLLKQTALSPDRGIHLNLGGDEVNDLFNFGDFDNVLSAGVEGEARRFELMFKFSRPGTERVSQGEFSCSYGKTSSGAVAVQDLRLSTSGFQLRVIRRDKGAFSLVVNDETQPRGKGRDYAPERSIALPPQAIVALGHEGSIVQDLSLAIRRELEDLRYLGPLRRKPERDYVWNKASPGDIGSDGVKTIDALLASALLRDVNQAKVLESVSSWLKRMKVADRIEARQVGRSTRYELVVSRDGVDANIRDVGIGISQVLPVLTLAHFAPAGSTIVLEEPEIHLHPLAQAVLAELFVETSRKRKVQFIVETHSEHLFRRMQTLIAQQKTKADECAMYFVERAQKQARLRPLQVDEYGAVANSPEHFFGDSVGEARAQAQARAQRMRGAQHG